MDQDTLKKLINALPKTDNKNDPLILQARLKNPRSHIAWSPDEDEILQVIAKQTYHLGELAELLQRSERAISMRLEFLRLDIATIPVSNNTTEANSSQKENSMTYKVIRYWRNSLADMDKMGLSSHKLKAGELFSFQAFDDGMLNPQSIERFFLNAEEEIKKSKKIKINTQVQLAKKLLLQNYQL